MADPNVPSDSVPLDASDIVVGPLPGDLLSVVAGLLAYSLAEAPKFVDLTPTEKAIVKDQDTLDRLRAWVGLEVE